MCESDGEADANCPGSGTPACVPGGTAICGRDDGCADWACGIWLIDVGSPSKSANSSAIGGTEVECLRGGPPGGLDGGG
jgi:hypothetical protein